MMTTLWGMRQRLWRHQGVGRACGRRLRLKRREGTGMQTWMLWTSLPHDCSPRRQLHTVALEGAARVHVPNAMLQQRKRTLGNVTVWKRMVGGRR